MHTAPHFAVPMMPLGSISLDSLSNVLHGGDYYEFAISDVPTAQRMQTYKDFLPADFSHADLRDVRFKRVQLRSIPLTAYDKHDPLLYFVPTGGLRPGDLRPLRDQQEDSVDSDDDEEFLPLYTRRRVASNLACSPPTYQTVSAAATTKSKASPSSTTTHDEHVTKSPLADVRVSIELSRTHTTYHIHYTTAQNSRLTSCSDIFAAFTRNMLAYVASQRSALSSLKSLVSGRRALPVQVRLYVAEDCVSHRLSLKHMGIQGELCPDTQHVVYTFTPQQVASLTSYPLR
ncbi:hypothetical protein RI367_000524 [Sorochytrium milnesiophthora]